MGFLKGRVRNFISSLLRFGKEGKVLMAVLKGGRGVVSRVVNRVFVSCFNLTPHE